MPHKCTKCGAIYSDGNSVILTGCPGCKWNKFLYVKDEDAEEIEEEIEEKEIEIIEIMDKRKSSRQIEEEDSWHIKDRIKEGKPINSVLEDIDRALDSDDIKKKEMNLNRLDSIRILDSGSYELNLESIMNNEEIVIGIRQDGQYAINLPQLLYQKPDKKKK